VSLPDAAVAAYCMGPRYYLLGKVHCGGSKSKYNNWLIAQQMLIWRREGRREKRV
jgi:hypothetical protein